ncbi:MAG: hypothetical protein E7Z70_07250 [Thermoplasmata archaeon]|nr:hypothetical protein [Thermoplasmata archaeon]
MSRKGWLFLIVIFSIMMLLSLISALIWDGRFGEDMIEYANWPTYIVGSIGLILILVFRKRIQAWEKDEE